MIPGSPNSQTDVITGIKFPKYGNYVAKINGDNSEGGNRYNINSISQTVTVANADVDPADNKIHVRFAWMAVLEDPAHPPTDQPFFRIELKNITKGTTLWNRFEYAGNRANQPQWKTVNYQSSTWQYVDWTPADLAFPTTAVAIGDQLSLEATAAGCAQSAHAGYVYLSKFDSAAPTGYQVLTVTPQGTGSGTVTSSPAEITCGSKCTGFFNDNASVTLTATPNSGSTFAGWSGACTTTPCTVTMNATKNVIATFNAISNNDLTITKTGTATGSVTSSSGDGITCGSDCQQGYPSPKTVTLTAKPASCAELAQWSGGCSGAAQICSVMVNGSTTVNAQFNPITYGLTVNNLGQVNSLGAGSGRVVSNPTAINCATNPSNGAICTDAVKCGQAIKLTATPDSGHRFVKWTGDACNNSTSTTCSLNMNKAVSLTATFAPIAQTLKVGKSGTGQGVVTSGESTPLINCGTGTACQADYLPNTVVTLTATPASGSRFVGWTNSCVGNNPITTVKMSAGRYCVAEFAKP